MLGVSGEEGVGSEVERVGDGIYCVVWVSGISVTAFQLHCVGGVRYEQHYGVEYEIGL